MALSRACRKSCQSPALKAVSGMNKAIMSRPVARACGVYLPGPWPGWGAVLYWSATSVLRLVSRAMVSSKRRCASAAQKSDSHSSQKIHLLFGSFGEGIFAPPDLFCRRTRQKPYFLWKPSIRGRSPLAKAPKSTAAVRLKKIRRPAEKTATFTKNTLKLWREKPPSKGRFSLFPAKKEPPSGSSRLFNLLSIRPCGPHSL